MKYHGNNPIGQALSKDVTGEVRDRLLRVFDDYKAAAEQNMRSGAAQDIYQRQLIAAECAVACALVVKEFHAVCTRASAEQQW